MASRSSFGVPPSICSARTPERMNSSRMWMRVRDADGKDDGLPALAELVPMRDDIADQLRLVHAVGKLVLDIVAGDGLHAFKSGSTGA